MIVDVRSLDLHECASEAVDRAHFVPMVTSDSAYAESPLCGAWCIHAHSRCIPYHWTDLTDFIVFSFFDCCSARGLDIFRAAILKTRRE